MIAQQISLAFGLEVDKDVVRRVLASHYRPDPRREYLDRTLFWSVRDLERKLSDFQAYYNEHRAHRSLAG